jgi:hypothetical protein
MGEWRYSSTILDLSSMNLMGDIIRVNTINKNTEILIDADHNHNIKTTSRDIEYVANFRYLGMTLTNQNWIHEEIKSRLNSVNVC